MNLKPVLEHVGILKNQFLTFVIIGIVVLNGSAISLVLSSERGKWICGLIMHLSTIPILIIAGLFYGWLLINMPGTAMERAFSRVAEDDIEEQPKKRKRSGNDRKK